MKCLLCANNLEDEIKLIYHYIEVHNVDSNNWFFKDLFTKTLNKFFIRKCYRCDEILTNQKHEQIHNFLKHYQQGGQTPLENKPIDQINIEHTIRKFSINFEKHQNSYNFCNLIKLPEEFFRVFNIKFKTDDKNKFVLKPTFGIVNYQPPPELLPGGVAIYDKRIWSTDTYTGYFFND